VTPDPGAGVIETPAPPIERLRVSDVVVQFGGISALRGVDFHVPRGEIRGLIGPNGAGKTTLFDVVSGLRPATSGSVSLDGAEITRWSPLRRARAGMRRTFQRQQVFSWLSVEDNVIAALEWRRGGGGLLADAFMLPSASRLERSRRDRVDETLAQCDLLDVRREAVGNLPIGVVRMVELARALIDDPCLLLLDEPTSGLQAAECQVVARLVREFRDRTGCTVVVVEHDIEFVLDLCDRVSVLDVGSLIFEGPPEDVRTDEQVRLAYLG
jgi:branched-chain amino acid transport system ATP-binding protein